MVLGKNPREKERDRWGKKNCGPGGFLEKEGMDGFIGGKRDGYGVLFKAYSPPRFWRLGGGGAIRLELTGSIRRTPSKRNNVTMGRLTGYERGTEVRRGIDSLSGQGASCYEEHISRQGSRSPQCIHLSSSEAIAQPPRLYQPSRCRLAALIVTQMVASTRETRTLHARR